MIDPLQFIKPQVRAMSAYTLKPYEFRYKMNQNENPLGFPPELKEQVFDTFENDTFILLTLIFMK